MIRYEFHNITSINHPQKIHFLLILKISKWSSIPMLIFKIKNQSFFILYRRSIRHFFPANNQILVICQLPYITPAFVAYFSAFTKLHISR